MSCALTSGTDTLPSSQVQMSVAGMSAFNGGSTVSTLAHESPHVHETLSRKQLSPLGQAREQQDIAKGHLESPVDHGCKECERPKTVDSWRRGLPNAYWFLISEAPGDVVKRDRPVQNGNFLDSSGCVHLSPKGDFSISVATSASRHNTARTLIIYLAARSTIEHELLPRPVAVQC